jgi:hypothetical protein
MSAERHDASIGLAKSLRAALDRIRLLAELIEGAEARPICAMANVAGD